MNAHRKSFFPTLLAAGLSSVFLFNFELSAQSFNRDRIDEQRTVRLAGNRHPYATPQFEIGVAAPDLPMKRMILALKQDGARQSALSAMLEALHDPNSPQYHQWLTPEDYARLFGIPRNDVERVTDWLRGRGFQIEEVPVGNQSIVFSGTASQVEGAFHTKIRRYRVNGAEHIANATDPEIPESLAAIVSGPVSLHNFGRKAMHHNLAHVAQYTYGGGHFIGPPDLATIYDANALYINGYNGTGETIGIVARINIRPFDIQEFQQTWGLPLKLPTILVSGTDPGIWDMNEEAEADLDTEWSSAMAPNATLKFVVSASTNSTDGADLSAQYIVSQNLADVMSASFGSCEAAMGSAERTFYSNLWQQASAQGITVFVPSGDVGAAGCDNGNEPTALGSQAINGLCSSIYSTCVGGTEFDEAGNNNLYWSASNNPTNLESALSYIPEVAWNESGLMSGGSGLWATGGGASAYVTKPVWQSGAGVPADGKRDVPDLALTAASGHDPYWIVLLGSNYTVGGTSAATPSMAGLMALIDQKNGGRQGNANTKFYPLAAAQASGGAAVFHGTTGGNNSVPGLIGFTASTHYNQATGLGSPDVFVLANHWNDTTPTGPTFTLTPSAASLTVIQGRQSSVTATVVVSGGFNSAITLSASGAPAGVIATYTTTSFGAPGSGSSVLMITAANAASPGSFTLTLTASGGGLVRTAIVNVTIAPPFAISTSEAFVHVVPGGSGSVTVLSAGAAGFSGAVALASAPPTGVTVAFNPTMITVPGSGSSRLTLSVASNLAPGTYPITISGTSGEFTRTTTLSLIVTAPPSFALNLARSAAASVPVTIRVQ